MEEKEEIKDLDNIKPIDHGTIAKPHTPVYKMHRYFARRPYSVFRELIKHYSNPGSIILSAVEMLRYLGWPEAAEMILNGIKRAIASKRVTYDLERQMEGATLVSCSQFGEEIIKNL